MLIVADTSPLNYLILIDAVGVLEPLYGGVIIPQEVRTELTDGAAPPAVRVWAMGIKGDRSAPTRIFRRS